MEEPIKDPSALGLLRGSNAVVRYKGISLAYLKQLSEDILTEKKGGNVDLYVAKADIGSPDNKKLIYIKQGQTVRLYDYDPDQVYVQASIPYANDSCSVKGKIKVSEVLKSLEKKQRTLWSTEDVCEYIVIPACRKIIRKGKLSPHSVQNQQGFYIEVISNESDGKEHVSTKEFKGAFISQARRCAFAELVAALENHFVSKKGRNPKEQFVWMDLFTCNQMILTSKHHDHETKKQMEGLLCQGLHWAIKQFDEVVMFADTWKHPAPLQRAWCVWEIYGVSKAGDKSIDLAFTPAQYDDFMQSLSDEYNSVIDTLCQVDTESAKCFSATDKEFIDNEVRSTVGYHTLNEIILSELREWLLNTSKTEYEKLADISKTADLGKCKLASCVGVLQLDLGNYDEAERYFDKALQMSRVLKHDEYIATNLLRLGDIFREKGNLEDAHKFYTDSLEILKSIDKNNDIMAECMNNYASLLKEQGEYEDAEKFFSEAIRIRKDIFGETNRQLAESYNDIALLYKQLERYDEAEGYFKLAIKIDELCCGNDHPEVATDLNNYGLMLLNMDGRLEQAEQYIEKALNIRERTLGKGHIALGRSFDAMGHLLLAKNKKEEAIDWGKKAERIYKDTLGIDHPWYKKANTDWSHE